MSNDNHPLAGRPALPRPDVEFAPGGTPPGSISAPGVKGILVNPLNAGAGPSPRLVGDAEWVAACTRMLKEEPPEQFLVNLLFMLRQSLGVLDE